MFVPVWIVVANCVVMALLLLWAISRPGRGAGDMLARQQAKTPLRGSREERDLMARPEVADALRRGHKIEAIRHVREASGLGLKAAKELVERHTAG